MKYALSMGVKKNNCYYFSFGEVDGSNCFCPLFRRDTAKFSKLFAFKYRFSLVTVPRKIMNQRIDKIVDVEILSIAPAFPSNFKLCFGVRGYRNRNGTLITKGDLP